MSVHVCKLKEKFTSKIEELYNEEIYLFKSCNKFGSKYTLDQELLDLQLKIYFEENNKIEIKGRCMKYCESSSKRKIKLKDISSEISHPEITIINNYIVEEDKWKKTDW